MEQLSNELKIKIMNFIPRRIHPVAVMVKDAIKEAEEVFFEEENLIEYIRLGQYCDCCGDLWTRCDCMCHHCHGEYKICKYECYNY